MASSVHQNPQIQPIHSISNTNFWLSARPHRCQAAFDAPLGLFRRVQSGVQGTSQRHQAMMRLSPLVMRKAMRKMVYLMENHRKSSNIMDNHGKSHLKIRRIMTGFFYFVENPHLKWMMTAGTPYYRKTSVLR